MKIRHKKLIASGIALSLAGVLGAGALLQTSVSVQASYAMMPGIEQIVKDTSEEKPFKILEIVDNTNEAEIGYYVSGQEPYVKLYEYKYTDSDEQEQTMKFQSLEEGLSKLPTSELRKEFADGTQTTNIKQIQNVCYKSGGEGQDSDYPLSYSEYREKYILSPDEKATGSWENDWKKIDFTDSTGKSKSYKVQVKGNYQENTAGTGDYTKKEQQYYPIRQDANDAQNKNEKVRENIQNFYYTGSGEANSPYFLTFEPVSNEVLNENFNENGEKLANNSILADYNSADGNYGYYENVYEDLTEEIANNLTEGVFEFPGENSSVDLNGAKKLLDTSVKNGTAFSSGEDEFMSVDDTTDRTQATQQDSVPEVPQAEEGNADAAFSDGDFTSGADAAETEDSFDSTGTGVDPQESAEPDNNVSADANTVSEATAGTDSAEDSSDNVESNPLIPYQSNLNEQGTNVDPTSDPSNPLVYYGETIDQYPFYKYTMISNLNAVKKQAETNTAAIQNGTFDLSQTAVSLTDKSNRKCNVTLEDGQYWFWIWEDGNVDRAVKYPVSIVTCRQPVSYNDVHKIPTELGIGNYYYKVSAVYFCCKKDEPAAAEDTHAYKYYGWYSPSYADESNPYIHEDNPDKATYYVSDAEYELTPGTGNYDFIPDDNATEQTVEVDHMYYQGGYTNHDWFKQYVFHLEPGEAGSDERKQFDAFKIEVTTITTQEFNRQYGSADETASAASGDSEATETTGDGDNTDSDYSSADDSVNSDDTQAGNSQTDDIQSDDVQTDNTSDDQNTDTQDTNETQSEDQAAAQNEGDISEVDPMVSEAGVELVSIEKELTEATDDSTSTDEFQDGTAIDSQTTEDSAQITNNISDEADASSQFTDNSADVIDDNGAFSAGDTAASNTSGKLAEYGLIYVNSSDINQAAAKEMSNIPTIINAAKLTDNLTTAQSFAAYIKGTDQDSDGHYVNTLVYVFKNTFAKTNEPTHQSDLINVNFHTNFNPDADGDSGSTASENAVQGFEEILKYIESENKYRKLGQTTDSSGISDGSDELSDGETVTPTPANVKIPLLKTDISQARVIEYIINYNYKRQTKLKSTINVLDIEPAKVEDSQKLQTSMVESWLGYGKTTTTGCANSGNPVNNMFDGDSATFWHSDWNKNNCRNKNPQELHHIDVTFGKPVTLRGFKYLPRPLYTNSATRNGRFVEFNVYLYTQDNCQGEPIKQNNQQYSKYTFNYQNDQKAEEKICNFNQSYSNVKSIKIEITKAGDNNNENENFASCAELSFITDMPEVKVTTMTAAEFVGHIDDIGSKYDMIYIGDQTNSNPNTKLLTGGGSLLYAHVGEVRGPASSSNTDLLKLLGQLDIDYDQNWSQTNENGKIIRRFAPINTYRKDGAGYYRGSGNDITSQICSELKEFVQSGYPVIFASGLMENDSRSIDTSKVDSASYYYEFMEYALKYENTFSSLELQSDTSKLDFFANLAKPVINFTEKPKEPHRIDETGNYPNRGLIEDGQLKYVFSIKNDSDAAPAVTTYDCNLYLDLNFDGNLSDREEQSSYIQITDESGQVISSIKDDGDKTHYELRAGKTYTLTRKLPEAYFKIITWKLEISSNRNPYIHTSETGYAKQGRNGTQKQTIKVLQLQADADGNYWDLTTGKSELKDRLFQSKIKKLNNDNNFDFNIQIESVSVTKINNFQAEDDDHKLKKILDNGNEVLNGAAGSGGYDMLIIGFADGFNNINNDCHQVEDILDFIKSGKSVLFSHDTTSYINYDQDEMYKKIATTAYEIDENTDIRTESGRFRKWGLELNRYLRSVVGMDRYGITSTEIINSGTGQTLSQLLKQGKELNADQVDFNTLMKLAGDVAYQNGDRNKTYAQTQAYSNEYLSINVDTKRVKKAEKINDGAITQYPYEMGDDPITLAETHGQYYQLGLEQDRDINGNSDGKSDVVVWYTLTDNYYSASPRDVRNNYYFYSKGNVIYTGAGHKPSKRGYLDDTGENGNKNEAEVNLFINAIVAAANVTAVEPKAGFVKSMNPNAGTEAIKYYMTDQTFALPDNEVNVVNNNIELYLNIKEYNMVSADLNKSDLDKQEMTIQFYIEDESGTIQENSGINKNLTDITRQIGNIKEYGGSKKGIDVGTDGMFHTKNSSVYSLKLNNIEQYLKRQNADGTYIYKNNCKVYAKVSSTVYLYNKPNTRTVWTSVDLKQRQLFDLD